MLKVISVTVIAVIVFSACALFAYLFKWDSTLVAGVITVWATMSTPFMVISISEFLSDRKDKRAQKVNIFKSLMTTRGGTECVTREHVNALNLIDLIFDSKQGKEREVLDAWQLYHNHLCENPQQPGWQRKQQDLMATLLLKMSNALGYEFYEARIRAGFYAPEAFLNEQQLKVSFKNFLDANSGARQHVATTPSAESMNGPSVKTDASTFSTSPEKTEPKVCV